MCPGLVGWRDVRLETANSLHDQARYHECFSLGLIDFAREDSSDLQLGWRELESFSPCLHEFSEPSGERELGKMVVTLQLVPCYDFTISCPLLDIGDGVGWWAGVSMCFLPTVINCESSQ